MNNQIISLLKIQNSSCSKLKNCTFNLIPKPLENRILKRNMRTMLHTAGTKIVKISHNILPKSKKILGQKTKQYYQNKELKDDQKTNAYIHLIQKLVQK